MVINDYEIDWIECKTLTPQCKTLTLLLSIPQIENTKNIPLHKTWCDFVIINHKKLFRYNS